MSDCKFGRVTRMLFFVLAASSVIGTAGFTWGQEVASSTESATGGAAATPEWLFGLIWFLALAGSVVALVQAYIFYKAMIAEDEGNERMVEIAGYVRQGANAYLKQQYIVVTGFFAIIVALLCFASFGLKVQSNFVPFAFLTGGF